MDLFMTGAYEFTGDGQSFIQQPASAVASKQNDIPFDNLLSVHQDSSRNNFPLSPLAMFAGEDDKKSSGKPTGILEGNEKIGSSKVETKRSTFPALLSNTGNFLFIEVNLLTQSEKDNVQSLTTDDNMRGTLSRTVESPGRNTSQEYFLLKDTQIFNSKPSLEQSEQKEDTVIQNLLTETTLKSLSENEMLSLFEQCEDNRINVKEDNFIDPTKKNPSLMGDLQALSSSKESADDYINPGFRINQFMIFQEDGGNEIYIPSDRLSFADTGSSSPLKALVQGEQFTPMKDHSVATDTPRQFFLRIIQPRIDTVPYVTGQEGKDNTGLLEKSRIINPKDFSPSKNEEIVPPPAGTSLKSAIVREVSSLVQDLVKKEGTTEKEHGKNQSPDAHITESGDLFPLLDNKNRNENGPLRVQILQEPQKAELFELPKKAGASIEVSLEPEGLGKIDIELTLNRGIVNAQINTSEILSKEIIERNLHAILSSLIDEGLNIGNFSVSLRNRQGDMSESNGKEALKTLPAIKEIGIPVRLTDSRMISIFV
jgi:hypothetical protein